MLITSCANWHGCTRHSRPPRMLLGCCYSAAITAFLARALDPSWRHRVVVSCGSPAPQPAPRAPHSASSGRCYNRPLSDSCVSAVFLPDCTQSHATVVQNAQSANPRRPISCSSLAGPDGRRAWRSEECGAGYNASPDMRSQCSPLTYPLIKR